MCTSTSTKFPNQKACKTERKTKTKKETKKPTSTVDNTAKKLILDRGSCGKSHKKLTFADPVFITSGIYAKLRFQSLTKSNGSPICVFPAVAGSVTATSSHVHFCQEEKLRWHSEPCGWKNRGISPLYRHSLCLVFRIIRIDVAWRQLGMVR